MVQRLIRQTFRTTQRARRNAIAVLASALLAGCMTEQPSPPPSRYPPPPTSRYPAPPPPVQNRPAIPPQTQEPQPVPQPPSQSERPPTQKPQSTVTLALQDDAQRAATVGDYAKAVQILERAIRIEPDRAELWLELARVHLKEGNAAQAEQFARKALLFTGNRYDLEQQAWVVIADAQAAER